MREVNLNEVIKVKLTPLGVNIFYHQYDNVPGIDPIRPQIDEEGYTKFQLWGVMKLYGKHIGMCKPDVMMGNMVFLEEDK